MKKLTITVIAALFIAISYKYEGIAEAAFKVWLYGSLITFSFLIGWCIAKAGAIKRRRIKENRDWIKEIEANDTRRVIDEILRQYESEGMAHFS